MDLVLTDWRDCHEICVICEVADSVLDLWHFSDLYVTNPELVSTLPSLCMALTLTPWPYNRPLMQTFIGLLHSIISCKKELSPLFASVYDGYHSWLNGSLKSLINLFILMFSHVFNFFLYLYSIWIPIYSKRASFIQISCLDKNILLCFVDVLVGGSYTVLRLYSFMNKEWSGCWAGGLAPCRSWKRDVR